MRWRNLRAGELTTLVGCILIIVSLVTSAYHAPVGALSAWETFGPAVALQIATLFAGLAMIVAALGEREGTAVPVATIVWCVILSLFGVVASVVRVLERPDLATATGPGVWFALTGCVLTLIGAWIAIRDERRDTYPLTRPTPRPRP